MVRRLLRTRGYGLGGKDKQVMHKESLVDVISNQQSRGPYEVFWTYTETNVDFKDESSKWIPTYRVG